MAAVVQNNGSLLLKLSATSLAFSTAVTKLISNYKEQRLEAKQEREFLKQLEYAYIENAEEELANAESLTSLSAEADLLLEMMSRNEQ